MLTSACQELYFEIAALQAAVGRRSRPSMGFAAFGHLWPSLPIAARSLTPARLLSCIIHPRRLQIELFRSAIYWAMPEFWCGTPFKLPSKFRWASKYVRLRYSWLMPIADRHNERSIASDSDYYLFAFDVFPSSPIDNNQRCSDGEGAKYLVGTEAVVHYQPSKKGC